MVDYPWGYVLKFNLQFDYMWQQPLEELEAIKKTLEMNFKYLDHLKFRHKFD